MNRLPPTQVLSTLNACNTCDEELANPDDDTEFLNFDYNNVVSLARRNLELAKKDSSGAPLSSASPPRQ